MILEARNISKSFDNKKVLDDISFNLTQGQITGLVGRNGSGKTTLLKILSRIIDPETACIKVDLQDLLDYPQVIEKIAYLPDRFDFFSYNNGKDAMEFYKLIYPNFDEKFVIEEAKKLKLPLNKNIKSFSKGNKMLMGLIIVLATNSEFLLVDEVLDGLDVLNREIIINYLLDAREEGRGILVSTHQLNELQGIVDDVIYLNLNGKIEGINKETDEEFHKVQVVVSESLTSDILEKSIQRFHLGRVYTLLMAGTEESIVKKLAREGIVQFDILPLQIEDKFYWERGKEEANDRL